MDRKQLYKKASDLPKLPGVYIMRDKKNEVIYVGKAKRLKLRVTSYFREGANHMPKVEKMVSNVNDFDVIVVDSEYEALTLECSLIKQHRPKYNILMMDDKGFSYIRISKDRYPRITAELQKKKDDAEYIGPYISSFAVKQMTEVANTAFKLPTCTYQFEKVPRKRPCLNAHLGLCSAPCAGQISEEDYLASVENAKILLTKGTEEILTLLRSQMEEASENLEFERAARARDAIIAIEKLDAGQKVVKDGSNKNMDVFAFAGNEKDSCAVALIFRNGKLVDKREQVLSDTTDLAEVREEYLTHFYLGGNEPPKSILLDADVAYRDSIEQYLTERRGGNVKIQVPQRGEQKKIVEMAYQNAIERLKRETGRKSKAQSALGELANRLGLAVYPKRIELYDISNYGADAVGGMVVFVDGEPKKSEYRRFKIKTVQGIDDYASMREVLLRRVGRYDEGSPGFSNKPELILLDGGKGHLDTILEAVRDTSFAEVPICGSVKDDKHRTRGIVSQDGEIELAINKNAFVIVSKMQDEVHRYTIEYERNSHTKKAFRSSLLDIEGIGETRAKVLLKHFKTIRAVSEASVEELASVKVMSLPAAQKVWEYYHS
ncbi:MAG: excinuclease ABC subunit UvrC [Oscillospiraceae bacterium]|nr:excinuclease ABC subunit UvrC [Oscillospiraceae bacterium]